MPTPIGREEVQRLLTEGAKLVEVLPPEEFAREHLPGAISLPLKTLTSQAAERLVPRGVPVVVYCKDTL